MYTSDRSYTKNVEFDAIRFPPAGYMPLEFFSPNHAWSVTLNPKKYGPPTDSIKIKIYPLDKDGAKSDAPLKLNYQKVDNKLPFGHVPNCIIFRPDKSAVAPGARYLVEIEGLQLRGGKDIELRYPVEFVRLGVK